MSPIFTINWKETLIKAGINLLKTLVYALVSAIAAFITNVVPGLLPSIISNPFLLVAAGGVVKVIGDAINHWLSDEQGNMLGIAVNK